MEKFEHEYGAEQIQVLDGLEHVRKRPGMYIGSVSIRGLHHLAYEIVDNCVDEALAGYCTKINIEIEPGNVISVEDNGRGIPVDIHPKTKISAAETVYTQLNAGGKFGGDSGYKVSGGLHGVGASVVNALSEWTEVTIQRDGGIFQMKFNRGKTIQKLTRIGDSDKTGTKVRFLADSTIFETLDYDYETLENRFREMAFLTKGLYISIEDKRGETPKKAEFCYEGGLVSFVEFLNKNKEKINQKPVYIDKDGEVPVEIAFQYTTSYSENIYSFVNNINTIEGGTHLEGFKRALTKTFNDYAKSHNILKEKDGNLQGEDIREGITAVISVKVREPQFEGQTKTKLGNSNVTGIVQSLVNDALSDRRFQAILPLWGKMLNVEKSRADKIYNNDKLQPVILAVGAGIGAEFDISKIRYGKIIIMADADVDGAHIRTLLLTFFFRYMRPLIENGNVYLAQPPLYKLSKRGVKDIYCYTDEEMDKHLKEIGRDGVSIQRYKGLGEMNPEQLWDTTMNPETRILVKVKMEDAIKADEIFTVLMGDEIGPRREFIQANAKYVKNLDI